MAFEQLGQTVPVEERELGWDDTIEKESAGFIIRRKAIMNLRY